MKSILFFTEKVGIVDNKSEMCEFTCLLLQVSNLSVIIAWTLLKYCD